MCETEVPAVQIPPVDKTHGVLALGCWSFGGDAWGNQNESDSFAAMEAALEAGMNHFDTAEAYGRGLSEELIGRFMKNRRESLFVATKGFPPRREPDRITAATIKEKVDASLARLGTDYIDLYYIHWPLKGRDMRPFMEGLEDYRRAGKVRAIGVSNFAPEQMDELSQAGRIDAHQFAYNILWRYPERDVIPYCVEHKIAVVTYSSIAEGILTGKFPLDVKFGRGDHRASSLYFEAGVWPQVHAAVERMKTVAEDVGRPLTHLAIRWVAEQTGITSVLVGARNAEQVSQNAAAMTGDIPQEAFDRLTEISEQIMKDIPDAGNIFRFYP